MQLNHIIKGMTHADDLSYVFTDFKYPPFPPNSESEQFSKLLVKLWVNFANTEYVENCYCFMLCNMSWVLQILWKYWICQRSWFRIKWAQVDCIKFWGNFNRVYNLAVFKKPARVSGGATTGENASVGWNRHGFGNWNYS